MHPHCIHGSVSALGLSFRNDSKDKRVGLGGTLACGPIQALVSQRDTAGFRPVQPGSMRSATVPAMLSPAGTHQGHFSRDLIGICFGALRAGRFDKWCGVCLNFGGEEPRRRESGVFGGGVGGTNKN